MAVLFSSLASGKSPTMLYTVYYDQTGRTATSVTYNVTVSCVLQKPAYDYYNAYVTPKIQIGGSTVSFGQIGTFPKGNTGRSVTKSITVSGINAGTSVCSYIFSATQSLGGTSSSSTGYVQGKSGTLPCSIFATTPSLTGTPTLKEGTTTIGTYYRENIGTTKMRLSWNAATGANGTVQYEVQRSIDGGTYSAKTMTSNTYLDVETGGGSNVRYAIKAHNTVGGTTLSSGWIYSSIYHKNKFTTAPTATCGTTVSSATKSFAITLGAAKDNMGSAMTYKITGRYYTAVRGTTTVNAGTVTINTNNGTSGTYMTWDDMKTAALGGTTHSNTNSYNNRALEYTITATNAYGSTSVVHFSVALDLGKDASVGTKPTLTVNDSSYYTISSTKYLFPEYKAISLQVPAVADQVGRYCSFDIYKVEGSTTTFIKNTGVLTASTAVSINSSEVGMSSASKAVKFFVRAKTHNGVTRDSDQTTSLTLHYYKKPTVSYNSVARAATSASFKVSIKANTSLSGSVTNTSTITASWTKGTSSTSSGTETYTVSRSGLNETFTQTVTVTVRDSVGYALNSGGGNDVAISVLISRFQPAFSIRQKGVGVNCINTGGKSASLHVNGKTYVTPGSSIVSSGHAILEVDTTHDANGYGNQLTLIGWHNNNDGKYHHYFRGSGAMNINTKAGCTISGATTIGSDLTVSGNLTVGGHQVFHAGNKPASGKWFSNTAAVVATDGVMEIGKYIDFHLTNTSTADFDGRISLTGTNAFSLNGGSLTGGAFTCTTLSATSSITAPTIVASNRIQIAKTGGGNALELKRTDGTNNGHNYISWYGQDNVRKAWAGIGGGTNNNFGIVAEDGTLLLDSKNGIYIATKASGGTSKNVVLASSANNTQVATIVGSDGSTQVTANGGHKPMTHFYPYSGFGNYVLGSRSVVVSAGQFVQLCWNMDNNSGNFDPNCSVFGYHSSFLPSVNGVITLGNSGFRWHTVYSTNALATSDSSYKENIKRISADAATLELDGDTDTPTAKEIYDFVKDTKLYSFDYKNMEFGASQYGVLADELLKSKNRVAEKFVYDCEDGAMISTQSYASALHIALQEAIKKIEQLENKIEELNAAS